VLVFGHHHPWDPSSTERSDHYFGINPDDSEALCGVISRCEGIAGYFAGHTHRNRVRRFDAARRVPIVEVAVRQGLPRRVGEYRIPRGWVHAARPSHRHAGPRSRWNRAHASNVRGLYRDYALGRAERPLLHAVVVDRPPAARLLPVCA